MAKLNDLTHEATRELSGTRSTNKAGLAIGTVKSGIDTANTLQYCINGIAYTKAAVTSTALVAAPGSRSFVDIPAGKTCYIVMCINAAGTIYAVQGEYAGQLFVSQTNAPTVDAYCSRIGVLSVPDTPNDLAPFGLIKVVNGSGSVFTIGTTLFDAASITTTFTDLQVEPATNP